MGGGGGRKREYSAAGSRAIVGTPHWRLYRKEKKKRKLALKKWSFNESLKKTLRRTSKVSRDIENNDDCEI